MNNILNNTKLLTDQKVNIICFLVELQALYKKYNISIAHQDSQGAFILEEFADENIEWIKNAEIDEFAGLSENEQKEKELEYLNLIQKTDNHDPL